MAGNRRIVGTPKKVGLVVVLTGDGKGKTTSALGTVLRASGHGMKSCVIFFMKGDMRSGEMDALDLLPGVELYVMGKGFCGIMGDDRPFAEHRASAQEAVRLAGEKINSGKYDLVVLDEINNALKLGLIDLPQVVELIEGKPAPLHLILTGRDAHPEIIKRAHTASEVKDIKHARSLGIGPQKGIDY